MISLKWIKSTNFYWLETNLCQNWIWNSQDLLLVLVEDLLNIVKKLKNVEKQEFKTYKNELDKASFGHDATYSDREDLSKRTISDKILKDKAYEITRNHGYGGYQGALASVVFKFFFDKKIWSGVSLNEQLAEELHEPVMKKFRRRKVHTRFEDNT